MRPLNRSAGSGLTEYGRHEIEIVRNESMTEVRIKSARSISYGLLPKIDYKYIVRLLW